MMSLREVRGLRLTLRLKMLCAAAACAELFSLGCAAYRIMTVLGTLRFGLWETQVLVFAAGLPALCGLLLLFLALRPSQFKKETATLTNRAAQFADWARLEANNPQVRALCEAKVASLYPVAPLKAYGWPCYHRSDSPVPTEEHRHDPEAQIC